MSCNELILLSTDPDDIAILEGPGVQSVNGKVGKVVLDAGDFAYDDTKEYSAGSVGAELKELSQKEIDVDSALSDTSTNPVQNKVVKAEVDDVKDNLNDKADVIISTASGSIAHFEDGAEAYAKSVIAHIEPVQEGSGDPSPTNVRPITGHTGMSVHVSPSTDAQDGATYTITFPTEAGTVYGGYVDVTNGELVVDMARVDMGTLNFVAASPALATGFAGRAQISDRLFGYDVTEAYCDSYAFFGNGTTLRISSDIQNGQFAYQATNTYVWFRNDSCSTLEELKTALSGVYLVYKLAEPIHYQLTPQQITTLLGTNNVWADTGDVEVEYRADTKLYIEQLTKPTEDDMTANANIASGKFFMIGNRLFLSTAAIASGDTINPGTNCTELSLADALNNLN